ncbi:MAG: pilus assembly PilX N-terminal domain-containing protein [Lachnospiraceae bacterium]|nr:pilus assembly PilX N-terminal domain-containing protein [Lachnospiraceae bacterium]
MMKNRGNNKGAALVAVLIGVLFIAILASSLLYMSTMNSKMKSMRQFSSSNFYTAEFGLSEVLSQVKQYCMTKTDPQEELKNLLKGSSGKFNATALNNLLSNIDGTMIDGLDNIRVHSIYDGTSKVTYEEDGNFIRLYGVTITSTMDDAHGSYESSVTTDIAFGFPPASGNKSKLNDFSILSDSPMNCEASSQYIGGDLYLYANGSLDEDALRVGDKAVVTIMSRYCFLQGDLTIKKSGCVYVAGTCIVDGDVNIEDTAQLIVGGKLYVRGAISGMTHVRVSGAGETHQAYGGIDWGYYDTNFPNGLANKLVADHMYLHYSGSGAGMDYELTQEEFRDGMQAGSNSTGILQEGTVGGVDVKAIYLTNNVSHGFENTLVLSPVTCLRFHGPVTNSLYLNTCPDGMINMGEGGGTQPISCSWGTMDDAHYEAAQKLLFEATWPSSNLGGSTVSFAQHGWNNNMIIDPATPNPLYPQMKTLNGIQVMPYHDGYYYNMSNDRQNYFPYSKFLSDSAADILGAFKGGSDPDPSGSTAQPTVFISNWVKD